MKPGLNKIEAVYEHQNKKDQWVSEREREKERERERKRERERERESEREWEDKVKWARVHF